MGIVDWRLSECERLGVAFRFKNYAGAGDVLALKPDVVVVATGGLPNVEFLDSGAEFATTSWDLLSGAARPSGEVIVYDDDGAHAGMTAAEYVAESGARLEIVTPERMLAPDVGGTSYPPYFRAFSRANAAITLNLRLESIERRGNRVVGSFFDEYGRRRVEKEADMIVVEHGAVPVEDLYFELKAGSINLGEVDYDALLCGRPQTVVNNPAGTYRLFRIGDAVASRNIHAAVYDAIRLMKDI
jgi:NADPH-dependent 2,4-dienoyl-CoA reductase/sulfur reductase-like enzyme